MFSPSELFRSAASELDAVERMCTAYDIVIKTLADDDGKRPEVVSQVLARRVVRAARSRERDPAALAERVLSTFGFGRES